MELKDLQDALSELKSQGKDDKSILESLYKMFVKGEIDLNQLEAVAHEMGYKLKDNFKEMSDEEQKNFALAKEEAEKSHPELNEDATEVDDEEEDEDGSEDENEDEDEDEDEDIADDGDDEEEDEDEDENDEEEEAMKYFGLNNK